MTNENAKDPGQSAPPDFAELRREYSRHSLSEEQVLPDPIGQFLLWLNEAVSAGANEPNAMALATCTADGTPSARIVLLKAVDKDGFSFYTNYLSRKGQELAENPRVALVFYWPELERQVRIEGRVTLTSSAESDAYFASRPPDARIGSAASPQSKPVSSRKEIEDLVTDLRARFPAGNVPRPPHWGGYRVAPHRVEFWQGRVNRLHDRVEYRLDGSAWKIRRLAP